MVPSKTRRIEYTLGRLAFMIASMFGSKTRPGKFISEFCIDWDVSKAGRERKRQTPQEMWAILNAIPTSGRAKK